MNFGLCTITNRDHSVKSVIRQAANAGYDGVEIWGGDHIGVGDSDTCKAIRRTVADHNLTLPVYGSYLHAGTSDFDETLEKELEIASSLNADIIRVWAGEREYGDHEPEYWNQVVNELQDVAEEAAKRNLEVTVEKHGGTLTNTQEGAQRLIEAVDRSNCGLNWQPLFGLSADAMLAEARALASISNHIHMQPSTAQHRVNRCALADAYFDVGAILSAFAAADFQGFVNVEFVTEDRPYEEAIQADLEYLRTVAPTESSTASS